MAFVYFDEQLKGCPKTVSTRVFAVPSEDFLKRVPQAEPFVISNLGYIASSDIAYTSEGEIEERKNFAFKWVGREKTPIVVEEYSAQFDEQDNLVYSKLHSIDRHTDYKTKEETVREKTVIRQIENIYSDNKKLCRSIETYTSSLVNSRDGKDRGYTHNTVRDYDESGRLTAKNEKNWEKICLYSYQGELLVSEESKHYHYAHDLFEQGIRYEDGWKKVYEYDESGHLTNASTIEADGRVSRTTKQRWNDKGELVYSLEKSDDFTRRIIVKGNKRCILRIQKRPWNKEMTFFSYVTEQTDDHGNVVHYFRISRTYEYKPKKDVWQMDRSSDERSYRYLYDEQGNWTRKEFYVNDMLRHFITREIVYF